MIDFSKLKTPPAHGDVLVMPAADHWIAAARHNQDCLSKPSSGSHAFDLQRWRREVRTAIAGSDDTMLFVLGHQPEFIHPGVWAKHIAAMRAASAIGGKVINLVVDSDAPKATSMVLPGIDQGRVVRTNIPFGTHAAGATYEQMHCPSVEQLRRAQIQVAGVMGDRYRSTLMPDYFDALQNADDHEDWVGRLVSARKSIESQLGISVEDVRVSRVWCGPMLVDMLLHAQEFAEIYNAALTSYRLDYRVRGAQRPIPDLMIAGPKIELPVWAVHGSQPRSRLMVSTDGGTVTLFGGSTPIIEISIEELRDEGAPDRLVTLLGNWRLRPRALALTMWARLLLADLFVHGIGGAKYDRISDTVIADYYGISPPQMACVSATLHMNLPEPSGSGRPLHDAIAELRDFRFNPQRYLGEDQELAPLWKARREAVERSQQLRAMGSGLKVERRSYFEQIRQLSAEAVTRRPDEIAKREQGVTQAKQAVQQYEIVQNREYFFGLYDQDRLRTLVQALPSGGDFGV